MGGGWVMGTRDRAAVGIGRCRLDRQRTDHRIVFIDAYGTLDSLLPLSDAGVSAHDVSGGRAVSSIH